MGRILDQVEGKEPEVDAGVRCPVCGRANTKADRCRHVRWTFEQGDALAFARFALETSPYVRGRGHRPDDIPKAWWMEHGDWLMEQIDFRLHIGEGYLFGELVDLDLLARDVWKAFSPDHEPRSISRVDR